MTFSVIPLTKNALLKKHTFLVIPLTKNDLLKELNK